MKHRATKEHYDVVILGAGNVAEAFARTLARRSEVSVRQIFARNSVRGRAVADIAGSVWCDNAAELAVADIYIIAVSDRAIAEVASLPFPEGAIVVHTAGSVPMSAIPARNGRRGILYALQSFSQGRDISLDDVPIFIEGDSDECVAELVAFAELISSRVALADSRRRREIHLAGVFVNNFTNHLYTIGAELMEREGLSFDILKPLIMEGAAKAVASNNPHSVQTGPAIRHDRTIVESHLDMLANDKLKQQIYNDLTNSIWETSKKI